MKRDPENEKLALGCDVIAPEGYGEIIGGGQREDNIDLLINVKYNLSLLLILCYIIGYYAESSAAGHWI